MRQGGFTLIELLAVVALFGIATAILVSGMSQGLASMRERQAINDLLHALRRAHAIALNEQRIVRMEVAPDSLCYQIEGRKRKCLPEGYTIRAHVALGVKRDAGFVFQADGSSSGGNLEVNTPLRRLRINVSWLTSEASLVQL